MLLESPLHSSWMTAISLEFLQPWIKLLLRSLEVPPCVGGFSTAGLAHGMQRFGRAEPESETSSPWQDWLWFHFCLLKSAAFPFTVWEELTHVEICLELNWFQLQSSFLFLCIFCGVEYRELEFIPWEGREYSWAGLWHGSIQFWSVSGEMSIYIWSSST